MNFRDLVTRLDLIEDSSLTLATVQAAEQAAKEKASVEKAKGGWTGFTSWDPKTAGNIAIAKLAQQNKLEGLFNSEGDFIIAYGDNEWSSKEGQSPRSAPPTPEDWKPLASLGLIPDNAKGPAGLTNWLTGGKSQNEFDAVKQQSAGVRQSNDAAVTPKSSGPRTDMQKADEVDDLIKQYLGKTVSSADSDSTTVASADGETDDLEGDQAFAEGMYESLVESFGYAAEATSVMGVNVPTTLDEFYAIPIVTLPNGEVIYDGADLVFDVGLSVVSAFIGPLAGPVVIPRLVKLAKILEKVFLGARPASKEAVSVIAKTYKERLATSIKNNLGKYALATSAGWTMGINALMKWAEGGSNFDPADLGKPNNSKMPSVDAMGNATGPIN